MKQKEIKVLMVEPGQHPKVTTLKNDLASLQEAVSIGAENKGLIEIVGIADGVCILCNEEGKLIGLEGNRRLGTDILVGVFYVVGENGCGDLVSLPDREIERYSKLFWKPEHFTQQDIDSTVYAYFHNGW